MLLQELFWHLSLYFKILWEQLKINWEDWRKEIRKILSEGMPPVVTQRPYQEYYRHN
jgi:hypothetical protein